MKTKVLLCLTAITLLTQLSVLHVQAASGTKHFTTFNAPGAGTGQSQGTVPAQNNSAGVIVGYYTDSAGLFHGFVRSSTGAITTFEAPGAGAAPGQGTQGDGITDANEIVGVYTDSNGVTHGYKAKWHDTGKHGRVAGFLSFDEPNAGSSSGQGTWGSSINARGAISGFYADSNSVFHGYIRSPRRR